MIRDALVRSARSVWALGAPQLARGAMRHACRGDARLPFSADDVGQALRPPDFPRLTVRSFSASHGASLHLPEPLPAHARVQVKPADDADLFIEFLAYMRMSGHINGSGVSTILACLRVLTGLRDPATLARLPRSADDLTKVATAAYRETPVHREDSDQPVSWKQGARADAPEEEGGVHLNPINELARALNSDGPSSLLLDFDEYEKHPGSKFLFREFPTFAAKGSWARNLFPAPKEKKDDEEEEKKEVEEEQEVQAPQEQVIVPEAFVGNAAGDEVLCVHQVVTGLLDHDALDVADLSQPSPYPAHGSWEEDVFTRPWDAHQTTPMRCAVKLVGYRLRWLHGAGAAPGGRLVMDVPAAPVVWRLTDGMPLWRLRAQPGAGTGRWARFVGFAHAAGPAECVLSVQDAREADMFSAEALDDFVGPPVDPLHRDMRRMSASAPVDARFLYVPMFFNSDTATMHNSLTGKYASRHHVHAAMDAFGGVLGNPTLAFVGLDGKRDETRIAALVARWFSGDGTPTWRLAGKCRCLLPRLEGTPQARGLPFVQMPGDRRVPLGTAYFVVDYVGHTDDRPQAALVVGRHGSGGQARVSTRFAWREKTDAFWRRGRRSLGLFDRLLYDRHEPRIREWLHGAVGTSKAVTDLLTVFGYAAKCSPYALHLLPFAQVTHLDSNHNNDLGVCDDLSFGHWTPALERRWSPHLVDGLQFWDVLAEVTSHASMGVPAGLSLLPLLRRSVDRGVKGPRKGVERYTWSVLLWALSGVLAPHCDFSTMAGGLVSFMSRLKLVDVPADVHRLNEHRDVVFGAVAREARVKPKFAKELQKPNFTGLLETTDHDSLTVPPTAQSAWPFERVQGKIKGRRRNSNHHGNVANVVLRQADSADVMAGRALGATSPATVDEDGAPTPCLQASPRHQELFRELFDPHPGTRAKVALLDEWRRRGHPQRAVCVAEATWPTRQDGWPTAFANYASWWRALPEDRRRGAQTGQWQSDHNLTVVRFGGRWPRGDDCTCERAAAPARGATRAQDSARWKQYGVLAWLMLLHAALGTEHGVVWRTVHDAWLAELATGGGAKRAYVLRHARTARLHLSNYGAADLAEGETVLATDADDKVVALRVQAMYVVAGGAHALRGWAAPLRTSPHWRPMFRDRDERVVMLAQLLHLDRERSVQALGDEVPGVPLRVRGTSDWRLLWPRRILCKVWNRHDCGMHRLAPDGSLPTAPPAGRCGYWVESAEGAARRIRLSCLADERAVGFAVGARWLLFHGIAWRFIHL